MTKAKRFVSWAAVSSLPQAQKISLTEQREINLRHIERYGGTLIADLIVDESRDIPELSEACERIDAYKTLRELIKSGGCDVVICLTRSRLGRVLSLVETIAELCRRSGIVIYETDAPPANLDLEGDKNVDLLTGAVRSWGAQREVEELRRRNKMGMLGKFKKGEFLNGVPWGWKTVYDDRGKSSVIVDPVAAETIRTALVTLYCEQGVGAQYICNELNARGYRTATGMAWTQRTASNIFRMIWRYAGYSEINAYSRGQQRPYARTKGDWPAILTEDELQRILAERRARRGKRGVGSAATYRFSLMVYCYYCKTRMMMTYQTRAHGRRVIYAYCENTSHLRRNLLVPIITEKVRDLFLVLQDSATWTSHLEDNPAGADNVEAKMEGVKSEIRKAEQAILKVDDKLIDGTFDEARHAHQVRRLREQIEQLQHSLTELEDRRTVIDYAARRQDRLQEIAEHGLSYLEMEDERAANALLRPLIRIWAKDNKVHRIELL
jgi:DNA invertase Pin-like site-specific DNA recombinase